MVNHQVDIESLSIGRALASRRELIEQSMTPGDSSDAQRRRIEATTQLMAASVPRNSEFPDEQTWELAMGFRPGAAAALLRGFPDPREVDTRPWPV